jgi:hypothetical protein
VSETAIVALAGILATLLGTLGGAYLGHVLQGRA